ncbi:MAG: hypothetical protein DSY91_04345 [Deltaproteobacteria bacterium]|nr:MAG: hypothetical protein DSY91_04345 [Deltaproteobacteria bacterium]
MTGILPFLILALILHAFFTPGTILWHVGPLYMTKEGLREGAWIMQKLGFFFYLSFVITSGIPSRFLFQLLERLGRFPPFKKLNLRLWILSLFLIVRWLRILPASWKFRVSEAVRHEPGRLGKTLKGLRHIPLILRAEVSGMGLWVQCLVLRGYAEGILVLAETPLPPLKTRDLLIISGIFLAWTGWIIYLL